MFTVQQENKSYTDYKNVSAYVTNIEVIEQSEEDKTETNKKLKYELQIADKTYEYETNTNIGSVGQSLSMIMTPVDEKDWDYKVETSLNEFLVTSIGNDKSSAMIMSKCVYAVILCAICNISYMNVRQKIKKQVLISDRQGRLSKDIIKNTGKTTNTGTTVS